MTTDPLAGAIEGDPAIGPSPAAFSVYKAVIGTQLYVILRIATPEGVQRHFIEPEPAKAIATSLQLAAGGIVKADAGSITPIRKGGQ